MAPSSIPASTDTKTSLAALNPGFVGPSPRPSQITHPARRVALQNFTPTCHHDTYPAISPSNFDLTGVSVLITGASRGIGRATAIRYAMAGASRIAICSTARSAAALHETAEATAKAALAAGYPSPDVLALQVDVTSLPSVRSAAEILSARWDGKLDVLVANAGLLSPWAPLLKTDPEDYWHAVEVNLHGLYLCTRFFLPLLLASELKTLVALSSIGAAGISPGASSYQIAKMAASRFAEFMDQDYHAQGLIAFSIHPGGVETDLGRGMPADYHAYFLDTPELAGDALVWFTSGGREKDQSEKGIGGKKGGRREWLAGRLVFVNWDVDELEGKMAEILERDLLKFRLAV